MNPSRDHLSPSEIERQLYEADQFLEGLFPETADEVRETLAMFGTTPVKLPERLREPDAVFDRMIEKKQAQQEPSAFGTLLTMLRTEKSGMDRETLLAPIRLMAEINALLARG